MGIENHQKRIHDLWWAHSHLSAAIENINSFYAIQFLIWISNLTFNATTRIYAFSLNKFSRIMGSIEDTFILAFFVILLIIFLLIGHLTTKEV